MPDITNTATPPRSAVTLTLTGEETAIARWALAGWSVTFAEVVAKGHMPKPPPAPTLVGNTLRLPLNLDALEELDYQLTIASRDHEDRLPAGLDPATGKSLMHRIRKSLPPSIKLSS